MLEMLAKLQEMGLVVESANFTTGQISVVYKEAHRENERTKSNLLIEEELDQLIESSRKPGAYISFVSLIKFYRTETGLSLSDAKRAVEAHLTNKHHGFRDKIGQWVYF